MTGPRPATGNPSPNDAKVEPASLSPKSAVTSEKETTATGSAIGSPILSPLDSFPDHMTGCSKDIAGGLSSNEVLVVSESMIVTANATLTTGTLLG